MKRQTLILLVLATLLAAAGCANKKKVNPTQTPQQQEEQLTEAERLEAEQRLAAERQRVQDSIALAEAEAARQQEIERQRIQDSIAQAEAAKRAMVQTLYIPRMTVTMVMQGKQVSTPATMRWKRGTGTLVSIQPFAGIEMFRMELDANALTIIDKINRRYTRMNYEEMAQMGARTTLDEIDNWIDQNIIARKNEPQLTLQVSRAGINGTAVIYTASMQTDVNINLQPTNLSGYKQVTLEQLVKGF